MITKSLLLFTLVVSSDGFLFINSDISRRGAKMEVKMAVSAASLIKKGKIKDASILKEEVAADSNHIVAKYLQDGTKAFGVGNLKSYFYNSSNLRYNTVGVVVEYNKKAKTGFIMGMPPPEVLGGLFRDVGTKAIIVSMDKRSGGSSIDEFERFAKEQNRARIEIPGPVPIIWNDFIVDRIQIAQAGAYGAGGIILQADLADDLKDLVSYSFSLQIEPIILAKDLDEVKVGISAGSRCLCLHTLQESELLALKASAHDYIAKNCGEDSSKILIGARIRPENDFSMYAEIDTTWVLRDAGFNFIWPSPEAIYSNGITDIYPILLAMQAKASRLFMSPRQFMMDRKKEGAQEFLGDILY